MPRTLVPTVCPYCAVGCGFYIAVEKGEAKGIEYMPDHPASEGALCPKGNAALEILTHEDRLRYPMKRKGEGFVQISWDEALNMVARSIKKSLREHGAGSLGFLASSKCTNEENYLMQKLARLLGTNNVDNCARLCHSPSVVGLNRALGAAGMTNPIPDLANSSCVFIIGSNLAENHPILSRYLLSAKERGAKVIVADPRYTPTAWLADTFLQIRPGTDVALINAMIKVIIDEGLLNQNFINLWTKGYPELVESVRDCTPEWASEITGVSSGDIAKAARDYARSPASAVVYSMGITQHTTGSDNVQALANLALISGQVGREGTGILPLRGQNNVQGACDMGALAEFYPGYRRSADPETAKLFSSAWGVESLPVGGGLTALEMMDKARSGQIKTMYIMGEDPANSDPRCLHTLDALDALEFLAVQDIFLTATAQAADVILPAAFTAEKEGTFTSTERRVQWSSRALDPPGEAKADLWILCQVAKRLGLRFDYSGPEDVLREINSLVPAYKGITKERLDGFGIIWPCPTPDHPGTPILHTQGFRTADGKGWIVPVTYRPPAETTSTEYPFTLTTGRIAVHHNAGSMTRRSPSLVAREPELFVEINPADAEALGIGEGDRVEVATSRGRTEAAARLRDRVNRGVVFMPFHYPGTNVLTIDARDPQAKIAEFKVAACSVSRRE